MRNPTSNLMDSHMKGSVRVYITYSRSRYHKLKLMIKLQNILYTLTINNQNYTLECIKK